MDRDSWDLYFLNLAKSVSSRASCPRKSHGCVIVNKDNTIISCGYNGAPPGCKTCLEVGCYLIDNHCKRAEHAERNALFRASMEGHSVKNCVAYITGEPCCDCIRSMISARIKKIVYIKGGHYSFPEEEETLRQIFIKQSGIIINSAYYF